MRSFEYTITDEVGLHARPAGQLVNKAKVYKSQITVTKAGKSAKATALIALMGLGIKKGDRIAVRITGDDEDTAAPEMEKFFRENL